MSMFFLLQKQAGTSRNAWELVSDTPFETREAAETLAKNCSTETLILENTTTDPYVGYDAAWGYVYGRPPQE